MMAQRMYVATTGFTLLAIPFFILAGNLMNYGGITQRVFDFARALVGHIRGGLGHVNVVASMIFSGMSGAAVADAAGLGLVEMKAMTENGYDKEFSAAITAASSTIGPVVPPSIAFVIYGSPSVLLCPLLLLLSFTVPSPAFPSSNCSWPDLFRDCSWAWRSQEAQLSQGPETIVRPYLENVH
jgi:tripartite ATP-independent transporter DctM subunit